MMQLLGLLISLLDGDMQCSHALLERFGFGVDTASFSL